MAKKDEEQSAEELGMDQAPEKISKMEAVRRILADDPEIKAGEGVEALRTRYGMEMPSGTFSAYKSQIKAKASDLSGARKKRIKEAPMAPAMKTDPLEAAQQVKALVDMYGAETVKGLAELFSDHQA